MSDGEKRLEGEVKHNPMALWNSVCETPKEYSKPFDNKRYKGTAIDGYYQIRRATSMWGPYGGAWGLRDMKVEYISDNTGVPHEVLLVAEFHYPGGAFPIATNKQWHRGHDHIKIAIMDAIKKALTYLGFSADVYMGAFDDDDYVRKGGAVGGQAEKVDEILAYIANVESEEKLDAALKKARNLGLSGWYMEQVAFHANARRQALGSQEQSEEVF